jgi:hypothetical protein
VDDDSPYSAVVYGLDQANTSNAPVVGTNAKLTSLVDGYSAVAGGAKWTLHSPLVFPNIGFKTFASVRSGNAAMSTGLDLGRTGLEAQMLIAGTTNVHTADEQPGDLLFQNLNSGNRISFYVGSPGTSKTPVLSLREDLGYLNKPFYGLDGIYSGSGKGVHLYKDGHFGVAPTARWFMGHSTDPAGAVDNNLRISSNVRAGTWEDWITLNAPDRTVGVHGLQHLETATRPTCDASRRGLQWTVQGGAGVADSLSQCMKGTAGTYSWVTIVTAP